MLWLIALLCAFSLALALYRFTLSAHPLSVAGSYQAIAHVFVGGLIGGWLVTWCCTTDRDLAHWLGWLALALIAVELVAATLGRIQ